MVTNNVNDLGLLDVQPPVLLHLLSVPSVVVHGVSHAIPVGCRALVVYVALHPGRVERRHAAAVLWPDCDDVRASGNLRSALWRLRRQRLDLLDAGRFHLRLATGVALDVDLVNRWAGRILNDEFTERDLRFRPPGIGAFDLLPGWQDEWLLVERERLRLLVAGALETLSRILREAGRSTEAVDAAIVAVAIDPFRDGAQRALVDAHLAAGNPSAAENSYLSYRSLIRAELGVDPGFPHQPRSAVLAAAAHVHRVEAIAEVG